MERIWLKKSEIKKLFKKHLTPFFKDFGYKYKASLNGNSGFVKKLSNSDHIAFSYGVYTSGTAVVPGVLVYYDILERILLNVDIPDWSLEGSFNPYGHWTIDTFHCSYERLESKTLYSEEDVIEFCEEIKNYFIKSQSFIEEFGTLKQLYENMQTKDLFYPLSCHQGSLFKATILYKIFDSERLNEMIIYTENYIIENYDDIDEWLVAYRKLCNNLDSYIVAYSQEA